MNIHRFSVVIMITIVLTVLAAPAMSFDNKFEKEVKAEAQAIKLLREVERGDYKVVSTDELAKWRDEGREMLIIDTMPFASSYKKPMSPVPFSFFFQFPT